MNFFIGFFLRILTANLRTPIFQNTFQVAASAEAYSGPCHNGAFLWHNERPKAVTIFAKKFHLRCFTRFYICLCSEVTSSIYQTYKLKVYCNSFWRHCNAFYVVFSCIKETLCTLSDVTLSKSLELLCDCMFAANAKTIIYVM